MTCKIGKRREDLFMTCRSTMYKIGKRCEGCFDKDKLATGTKLLLTMEVLWRYLGTSWRDRKIFVPRAMCIQLYNVST